MRVVTVARKPCTAASAKANVVAFGSGALNIDAAACRTKMGTVGACTVARAAASMVSGGRETVLANIATCSRNRTRAGVGRRT